MENLRTYWTDPDRNRGKISLEHACNWGSYSRAGAIRRYTKFPEDSPTCFARAYDCALPEHLELNNCVYLLIDRMHRLRKGLNLQDYMELFGGKIIEAFSITEWLRSLKKEEFGPITHDWFRNFLQYTSAKNQHVFVSTKQQGHDYSHVCFVRSGQENPNEIYVWDVWHYEGATEKEFGPAESPEDCMQDLFPLDAEYVDIIVFTVDETSSFLVPSPLPEDV